MREGQMLELLPPQLRQQDPLISACESLAERTGRFTLHGQEILDWMTPLFSDETEAERRLRYAACLLSDIGWSEHPDYRAIHAFHRVLRIPYPGLLHSDRAMLALAVLIRYGGNEDDRFVAPVRTLLSDRSLDRARVMGLALRLSQSLSGGAAGLLPRAKLKIDKNTLTLDLRRDEVFRSEAVERRFGRLAKALNLKPSVLG
jgi:exopolyphosphatase/guanosine-5'-triphosphate,3'-diphosphate pyrophosphatase